MAQFWQQVVSGLADGGIYAALALAIVLIYRATGIVSFAHALEQTQKREGRSDG